ncbi:MAG: FAD-dependent oxidoreductase [Chloroflexi bacterium HGW-Chloroflexi-10]|nr:MAG: FAD-dependent oxidoreductase [Chloroflexi bacterium HGW-Chloroflexi-10]
MFNYSRQVIQLPHTQVVVVGSGSAGATAAITAARLGLQVTLVERYGFMGGISTQVLDTFYGFFTPGEHPRKVVGGIPDLVIEELLRQKAAIYRPNTYGAGQGITYDPERLKIIWEQLAKQSGVEIIYHSLVIDIDMQGQEIRGIILASKSGLYHLPADIIIDASGDADLAAYAGVAFESALDQPMQSLTTTFKLINVDILRAHQIKKSELHGLMANAAGYDLPRKEGSVHITPLPGVMATNMTRVTQIDPNDIFQLSAAEIEGRRQALEYARFLIERVPGYEQAALGGLSTQIGVRESRRIFGQYRLTRTDVLNAQKFEDGIAVCGAPIEEHHAGADTRWEYLPDGETYQIPYRCLLPQNVDRLMVAGRCLSADHDAHASVRSMGQCMAMGQAAAAAAKVCIDLQETPQTLSSKAVQQTLRSIGAILE